MVQQAVQRKSWFSRAWRRLTWRRLSGTAALASAILAAFAASYTRDIACTINHAEMTRVNYEPLKFSHEMYDHYIKSITWEARAPRLACHNYLFSNTTDDEIKAIIGQYRNFKYDENKHAKIRELCFEKNELAGLTPDEMIERLNSKLRRQILVLDGVLIGFKHPIGNQNLICENFSGFLTAGVTEPEFSYGILGKFLQRSVAVGALRSDNYGNLKCFTDVVGKISSNYQKVADCDKLKEAPSHSCRSVWETSYDYVAWIFRRSGELVGWITPRERQVVTHGVARCEKS